MEQIEIIRAIDPYKRTRYFKAVSEQFRAKSLGKIIVITIK